MGASIVLDVANPCVKCQVFRHLLVRIQINGVEPRAPGFGFRKLKEGYSKTLPTVGGTNSHVVNKKSFVANSEDDYTHDGSVAFGDGYSTVGDDLRVVVCHRPRQHTDALYVVLVGGVNERSHFLNICSDCGPKRILNHCAVTGSLS